MLDVNYNGQEGNLAWNINLLSSRLGAVFPEKAQGRPRFHPPVWSYWPARAPHWLEDPGLCATKEKWHEFWQSPELCVAMAISKLCHCEQVTWALWAWVSSLISFNQYMFIECLLCAWHAARNWG